MRDPGGRVRLMDFGIAKSEATDRSTGGGGLTTTGQIMGTPEYMSPEQCLGDKIDHRSDVYALGIAVYEIFTGTVPFRGDTPVATLFKHIQDPVPFEGPVAARDPARRGAGPAQGARQEPGRPLRLRRGDGGGAAPGAPSDPVRGGVGRGAHRRPPRDRAPRRAGGTPTPTPSERRRVTRLDIFVNFKIRRLGTAGTVLQEERTIAENVGRGGARVMTSMASLAPGDIVHLEEVGGPFKTRAEVRGSYVGKDNIRRLNLRFVDSPAPDYLVHVDDSTPRR